MNILVTGGAGFIGSHFIEYLLANTPATIFCLDNFNDYYDPALKRRNLKGFQHHAQVRIVEQDFCQAEAVAALFAQHRFTHVVHLGAYAGVRYSIAQPQLYERSNVLGTLSLLEAARQYPVERFLLASSSTVYGRDAKAPFVEDAPLGIPMSPYGATKRAAELLGLTYHGLHALPVVCVRPFSIYGPRLRPDLALAVFSEALSAGKKLPLFGDGSICRDFTHISDFCAGLFAALHAPGAVGEAINLGHHEPTPIRDVIAALEQAFGRPANIDYQPAKPGDMPITNADLSKARRLLGYQPRVDFQSGINEYVAWFRQQHV